MATVEVEYSTPQGGPPPPPSRTFEVPIEEYTEEERDTLQVHFYPKGRVRIVVSKYFPGHPKYPAMEGVEVRPTSLWNYCKKVMPSDPVCKTMPKDPPQ